MLFNIRKSVRVIIESAIVILLDSVLQQLDVASIKQLSIYFSWCLNVSLHSFPFYNTSALLGIPSGCFIHYEAPTASLTAPVILLPGKGNWKHLSVCHFVSKLFFVPPFSLSNLFKIIYISLSGRVFLWDKPLYRYAVMLWILSVRILVRFGWCICLRSSFRYSYLRSVTCQATERYVHASSI